MAATAIDTLQFARKLKDAGVPSDQAEAMAEALGSELVDQLVTKPDLKNATLSLEGSIRLLRWMLGFILALLATIALKLLIP